LTCSLPAASLSSACRAFLKAPSILLFDEATSALDAKTEKEVLEALSKLAAGRTSIFVAHRLSTAAACDQIVVLEDGRVAEAGSHGELLEAGGRYAALWARQASVDDVYDAGGTDADESGEEQGGQADSSSGSGSGKVGGGAKGAGTAAAQAA
jgi:ABC transporter ATM